LCTDGYNWHFDNIQPLEDKLYEIKAQLDVAGAASQKLAQEKAEKKAAKEAAIELEKQARLAFEK
jgi:uncharacterized protein YqfA (UPF0365 family)